MPYEMTHTWQVGRFLAVSVLVSLVSDFVFLTLGPLTFIEKKKKRCCTWLDSFKMGTVTDV